MNKKSEPIKIAMIMGKMIGGGVESVIMNYYKFIDKSKIQFDFICDEDSTNIPYDEIEKLGGKVILCPPYQKIFKYNSTLTNLFKEKNYKIVHSNINVLSIFPLRCAKKAGVPIRIAHSHSTSNKKEWKKNIVKNLLRPFSKIYANKYFACSKLAGDYLFGKQTKYTIINNAINLEKFKYNEEKRKVKRAELEIDDDIIVIGHIGRFVDQKNHTYLIDIFNEINKIEPKTILLLAGQGPLENKIKDKVKNMNLEGKVKFLGQRNDVSELYQAFDVFLLPSLYEGLPVVGVEAQTAGLLCYLSDDMTKETKVIDTTVFMSINQRPEEWAKAILKDQRKIKRIDTSVEVSKNGFNIQKEAIRLQKIYYKLLGLQEV